MGIRAWWIERIITSNLEVHIDKIEFRTILRESHTFVIDMNLRQMFEMNGIDLSLGSSQEELCRSGCP